MAYVVVDRRKNDRKKSSVNRQRFMGRVKKQVNKAVKDLIRDGKIEDIISNKDRKVKVPVKDLNEPMFQHGKGGVTDRIYPGNKEFVAGDRVPRPKEGGGQGGGSGASDSGEGEDDFVFTLTKEEFLDIFFEDLALPDLVRKELASSEEYENRRAGFTTSGTPSRLNIVRSMKQAKSRRFSLRSGKKKKVRELEAELENLESEITARQGRGEDVTIEKEHADKIRHEIEVLKRKIKAVPFIDEMDLRYNLWTKVPVPTTQAVMFCIMDVSGSMGEWEKEMAKRFFMLLYLFLTKNYDRVDLVFIRHHTVPKEVDQEEFFYSKESGGTIVSPALKLMKEIVDARYPLNIWNVYACQASDGDNWPDDCAATVEVLNQEILPITQYFAYIELNNRSNSSTLWPHYETVETEHANFAMERITSAADIFPVFRGLFDTKEGATLD